MKYRLGVAAAVVLLGAMLATGRAETPFDGCYERLYEEAHLAAHRGQIVRHVKLKVDRSAMGEAEAGDKKPIIADAGLEIWVTAAKPRFATLGACYQEGEELICNAALSAAETEICKKKADGVRDCRADMNDAGSFRLAIRPEGLLLSVNERLELSVRGDGGPWLYLSPGNVENHAFLLKAVPQSACK